MGVNSKAFVALAYVVVGLIAITLFVSLIRDKVDGTGVIVSLSAVLTGLIGGMVMREAKKKDDDE